MYIPRSVIMALFVAGLVALWLLSGRFFDDQAATGENTALAALDAKSIACRGVTPSAVNGVIPPPCVRVRNFLRQSKERVLVLPATTNSSHEIIVRSEISGILQEQSVAKGGRVKKDDLICRIDIQDHLQQLTQRKAVRDEKKFDLTAAEKLFETGLTSEMRVMRARAAVEDARVKIDSVERTIERTKITAPIDGIVRDYPRTIGEVILVGETCAEIVSDDPIEIIAYAPQISAGMIVVGQKGRIEIINGMTAEGTVRYISPLADSRTRRFRLELAVPNTDGRIPLGVTARLELAIGRDQATFLPHSTLTLSDSGELGVWTVAAGDKAAFVPVTFLEDQSEGIWVSGLPEDRPVIILGQHYVKEGQKIIAIMSPEKTATEATSKTVSPPQKAL